MSWSGDKLNRVLALMEASVQTYRKADNHSRERMAGEILGYWFYQVAGCKDAPAELIDKEAQAAGEVAWNAVREWMASDGAPGYPARYKVWSELDSMTRLAWMEIARQVRQ